MYNRTMYKSLKDLGITPHNYSNKKGNGCLDDLVKEVNQLCYDWGFVLLSKRAAGYLCKEFDVVLSKLRQFKFEKSDACYPRWVECGKLVREYKEKLEAYSSTVENDEAVNEKVLKRFVGQFIKDKETMSIDDAFQLAKKAKLYSELYGNNVQSFMRMREELITRIKEELC